MTFVIIGSIIVSLIENEEYNQKRSIEFSTSHIDRLFSLEDIKLILPYVEEGNLFVYYRKCDLNYFNFENIKDKSDIPLSGYLGYEQFNMSGGIIFNDVNIIGKYYKSRINAEVLSCFLYMDDEFEDPSNNQSRGGKRAIFFLNQLAKIITNDRSIATFCIKQCENCSTLKNDNFSVYSLTDHDGDDDFNKHKGKILKNVKCKESSKNDTSNSFGKGKEQEQEPIQQIPRFDPLNPSFPIQQIPRFDPPNSSFPTYSGPLQMPPNSSFPMQQIPRFDPLNPSFPTYSDIPDIPKTKFFTSDSMGFPQPVMSPRSSPVNIERGSPVTLKNDRRIQITDLNTIIDDNVIMSYDDCDYENPKRFVGCNSVFRLNKFSPGDSSFKFHFDTPFYDRDNNHLSLFTILIYLTSGSNPDGVLRIYDGTECSIITHVEAGDVIIFNQQYPHIGNPFIEGDKVFLRSELIFEMYDVNKDNKIADIFNQACYFQLQSNRLKSSSLQKYSSDLFNETMRLRNSMPPEIKQKYLLVKDDKMKFITNGTFYYFADTNLDRDTILQYSECVVNNYFNKCPSEYVKVLSNIDNPLEFLNMFMFHNEINEDKEMFGEQPELRCSCGICDGYSTTEFSHQFEKEYIDIVNTIPANSTVQLEDNIFLNDAKVVMKSENSGIVVFQSREKGFNFASCQGIYDKKIDDFNVKDEIGTLYDLPPIEFRYENGYIFTIDMFKCGFKYSRPIRYVTFA